MSTAAPCRALPLLGASRQPCQDLGSCWHSSTMATAAAALGKAFSWRWRQDRLNEKPGPLNTNKIIQGLSTSPQPEAGRAEPSVLMGVPSRPIWGCFPRFSHQRQPRTVCVASFSSQNTGLLPAHNCCLQFCSGNAGLVQEAPQPHSLSHSTFPLLPGGHLFHLLSLKSSDVTDFSFCYAPEDGHRADLMLMRIFPAEAHSCCNSSPTLTSSTLSLLLSKISCTSCPMSVSFLLHQVCQSPLKLAKYQLTSVNYTDNNGLSFLH